MFNSYRTFILIMILVLLGLIWWVWCEKPSRIGQDVDYSGLVVIVDEPRTNNNVQKSIAKSKDDGLIFEIITGQMPAYTIGDVLSISGSLHSIERGSSSYESYLSRGISGTIFYPNIQYLGAVKPDWGDLFVWFRRKLVSVRMTLTDSISRYLHDPQAGLLNGIIFGEKANFPSNLSSAFSRTGLSHIVALSGYNITIVIAFLSILINRGNRRLFAILCIFGIATFILATGLSSSVVRAGLMGSVFLLAGFWGRRPDGLVAILFAALVMALLNPYILLYDVGFQLSFAAMMGMIMLAPRLEIFFAFLGATLSQILAGTVAAQLFTWPIISINFGIFSVLAPLTNLIVLPLIPVLMFFGFVLAIAGLIAPMVAKIVAIIPWLITSYIENVARNLSEVTISAIPLEVTSPLLILGYYVLIFDLVIMLNGRKNAKKGF